MTRHLNVSLWGNTVKEISPLRLENRNAWDFYKQLTNDSKPPEVAIV